MRWFRPLLASTVVHLLPGLALLFSWPREEVSRPRISVFLRDKATKKTQVDVKERGSGTRMGLRQAHRNDSRKQSPTARNALLKPPQPAGLMPKRDYESAKPKEFKLGAPDLRVDKYDTSGWHSQTKRDGSVQFTDKPVIKPLGVPDITELVMRLRGDPLYDPEKRKYLKNTKVIREAKAQDFKRENLTQSLSDLGNRLTALWFDDTLSVTTKKQRLFDMWEECAEEGSEAVLMMSEIVRTSIKSFIRQNMPKSTELAYTDEDLMRLNKNRKSKAEFNPYS